MSLLDRLRRPEYTGERRCWPCTAVNAAVVVAAAAVVGAVSVPGAVAVVAAGGALVYLRGYVVPYTPRFAPRLVDPLPFDVGHADATDGGSPAPADSGDLSEGAESGEAITAALLEAGVLVEDGEGIALSDSFAGDWRAEMARLREGGDDALATAVADAAPYEATARIELDGVTVEGAERSAWLARPLAVADAAAVRAMADRGVPPDLRAAGATPLRMLLPECPTTGGPVEETTWRDCCGGTRGVYDGPERRVLACAETGELLYEFE
jgi:hypothetical protein